MSCPPTGSAGAGAIGWEMEDFWYTICRYFGCLFSLEPCSEKKYSKRILLSPAGCNLWKTLEFPKSLLIWCTFFLFFREKQCREPWKTLYNLQWAWAQKCPSSCHSCLFLSDSFQREIWSTCKCMCNIFSLQGKLCSVRLVLSLLIPVVFQVVVLYYGCNLKNQSVSLRYIERKPNISVLGGMRLK